MRSYCKYSLRIAAKALLWEANSMKAKFDNRSRSTMSPNFEKACAFSITGKHVQLPTSCRSRAVTSGVKSGEARSDSALCLRLTADPDASGARLVRGAMDWLLTARRHKQSPAPHHLTQTQSFQCCAQQSAEHLSIVFLHCSIIRLTLSRTIKLI